MALERTLTVRLVGDSTKAQKSMQQLSGKSESLGSKFKKTFAVVGGGFAIAGAIKSIASIGMKYEDTLATFKAVSGANSKQMAEVGKVAKALGNDVKLPGTSAADAAVAMTELAKAGMTTKESMAAARGSLLLAAAAGTDAATASQIQANALNAFNLKGTEAGRVADLLAASANASSAEITDMAAGTTQAAAQFNSAGFKIDELTTSLGLMANAGIKGSDAGTSLKTMAQRLQAPTDVSAKLMKKLGINVRDSHGNMLPMRDIIGEVGGSLKKLSPAQRDAAIQTIFGADASRAANIVLGQGVGAYDKMHKAVTKAGAAQQVAGAKAQTMSGKIEALKSSLETMAITIFQASEPAIKRMVSAVTTSVAWIDRHRTGLAQLAGVLLVGVAIYKTYRATIAVVTAATRAWNIAQAILNGTMRANPIGIVVTLLAVLAVGLVVAYKKSETFRNIVKGAFSVMLTAVDKFTGGLSGVFRALSHVPGFGWAKTAANLLDAAGDKARRLRDELNSIPRNIRLEVRTNYTISGNPSGIGGKRVAFGEPRAGGGPVKAGSTYIVGEEGPEVFVPKGDGRIIPNGGSGKSAPALSGGGNTGDSFTVVIPIMLDGREVARITAPFTRDELIKIGRRNGGRTGL